MTNPINNSNTQSFLLTPLKIVKSIGWVALAILALPSSLVGYKHSRLFLGKAVAVWRENHNSTTSKTDSVVEQQRARLRRIETENLQKDNVEESIPHNTDESQASISTQLQAPSMPSTSIQNPVTVINQVQQAGSDLSPSAATVSSQKKVVEEPRNIKAYADIEWRGDTPRAIRINNGYSEIFNQGFTSLRRIRGDNYCGLRATLFQALRQGGVKFPSADETLNRLKEEIGNSANHWLLTWNFNNAQHDVQLGNVSVPIEKMQYVLSEFERVTSQISNIKNKDERTAAALLAMNREVDDLPQGIDPKKIIGDAILMEALKLHMMASALDLYKKQMDGGDVPIFSFLMYARDTSKNPQNLLKNHINTIGITGGAEQVEVCLLGHTLGKPLKVARLASYGTEDFISVYPEVEGVDQTLKSTDEDTYLVISAEDDRHYNAITTEQ